MFQVQILVGLPVVETWVRTCVKEASESAKLSVRGAYGMPSCRTNYRSGYAEQFAKTHASGLDPT
eukprot:9259323-Ditylum_brightwellii.AAC.1